MMSIAMSVVSVVMRVSGTIISVMGIAISVMSSVISLMNSVIGVMSIVISVMSIVISVIGCRESPIQRVTREHTSCETRVAAPCHGRVESPGQPQQSACRRLAVASELLNLNEWCH